MRIIKNIISWLSVPRFSLARLFSLLLFFFLFFILVCALVSHFFGPPLDDSLTLVYSLIASEEPGFLCLVSSLGVGFASFLLLISAILSVPANFLYRKLCHWLNKRSH